MAAKRYRKKPVVIEAMGPLDDGNAREIAQWCGGSTEETLRTTNGCETTRLDVDIHTLEGTMTASPGDYIIRGVQGEFYPCKPDIFTATYEEADQ